MGMSGAYGGGAQDALLKILVERRMRDELEQRDALARETLQQRSAEHKGLLEQRKSEQAADTEYRVKQLEQQQGQFEKTTRERSNDRGLDLMESDRKVMVGEQNDQALNALVQGMPEGAGRRVVELRRRGVYGVQADDVMTPDERAGAEGAELGKFEAQERIRAKYRPPPSGSQPDQQWLMRNGQEVYGEYQPGDSRVTASSGMAAAQIGTRNNRAAAALNSIEKLKELAPVRTPGPKGIAEGAGETVKGYLGYNTKARQYSALLGPTAMQMAVAIQGAANLSDTERETMKGMLGSIAGMDYESQLALLDNAAQLISNAADVQAVDVPDPKTGRVRRQWAATGKVQQGETANVAPRAGGEAGVAQPAFRFNPATGKLEPVQ
jgi:hypothetical protein